MAVSPECGTGPAMSTCVRAATDNSVFKLRIRYSQTLTTIIRLIRVRRRRRKPRSRPFRYVTRHIVDAEWAHVSGYASHRQRLIALRFETIRLAQIQAVAPRINPSVCPTGREFPLRLARQANAPLGTRQEVRYCARCPRRCFQLLLEPAAIVHCVKPLDSAHRKVRWKQQHCWIPTAASVGYTRGELTDGYFIPSDVKGRN
jgi:hypothetical protein